MANDPRSEHKAFDILVYGSDWLVPRQLVGEDIDAWARAPLAGAPLFARLFEPLGGIDTRCVWVIDEGPASQALARALRCSRRFGANVAMASSAYLDAPTSVPTLAVPASGISVDDLVAIVSGGARAHEEAITVLPMQSARREAGDSAMLLPRGTPLLHMPIADRSLRKIRTWIDNQSRPLELLETSVLKLVNTPSYLVDRARAAILDYHTTPVGELRGTLLVGDGVHLSGGAVLNGTIAIGANTVIAPGAVLCNGAVIGERCYVGEGAMISDAVVLDGVHVRGGDHLVSAVLGRHMRLDAIGPTAACQSLSRDQAQVTGLSAAVSSAALSARDEVS